MSSSFLLLPTEQYLDDIIQAIDNATERVCIMSLIFTNHQPLDLLVTALINAEHRGVDVSIACDLFFSYREFKKHSDNQTHTTFARNLRSNGIKIHWLGTKSGLTLFSHRTHSKWTVVDDVVYSFGGINLYPKGVTNADYMLKITSVDVADIIAARHKTTITDNNSARPSKNLSFSFDDNTVHFDGGRLGKSVIYSRACELAEQAESVTIVSQYCPTGRLTKILKTKPTRYFFNQWKNASSFHQPLIRWSMFIQNIKTEYTKNRYLHAKCIIYTMPNGKKVALTGSHNFVSGGGWMGTREIALETTNPSTISKIESYLSKTVTS